MSTPKLTMGLKLWNQLMKELKKQGEGKRETGAFLLSEPGSTHIIHYILYNEVDPSAFDSGIIVFNGDGYISLWQHCSRNNHKVVADVHTHPGDWTGQSGSDKAHPMIAQSGHLALIVPRLATIKNQKLKGLGIHEFLGDQQWTSWSPEDGIFKLIK